MRTFCGLDGSQMFQMQMTVQLSRRTALGFAVGLCTDIMVNLCTWEKCTRLTLRPATVKEARSVIKIPPFCAAFFSITEEKAVASYRKGKATWC